MATGYSVGIPRLDTDISETGTGFVRVWEVPYRITDGPAKGTSAYVRIPADEYDADTVHEAITQAINTHHEVMGR